MTYKKYILPSLGTLFLVLTLAVMTSNVSDPLKQQLTSALAENNKRWRLGNQQKKIEEFNAKQDAKGQVSAGLTGDALLRARERTGSCTGAACLAPEIIKSKESGTDFGSGAVADAQNAIYAAYQSALSGNAASLKMFQEGGQYFNSTIAKQLEAQLGTSGSQSSTTSQEQKDICLMDGGFWLNNSCSYPDIGQLVQDVNTLDLYRTFASGQNDGARNQIVDLCKSAGGANCDADPRSFAVSQLQASGITTPTTTTTATTTTVTAPISALTSSVQNVGTKSLDESCTFNSDCQSGKCGKKSVISTGNSCLPNTQTSTGTTTAEVSCPAGTARQCVGSYCSCLTAEQKSTLENLTIAAVNPLSPQAAATIGDTDYNLKNLNNYAVCAGSSSCNNLLTSIETGLNKGTAGAFENYTSSFQQPYQTWQVEGYESSDAYIRDCVAKNGVGSAYSCMKQSSALTEEALVASIKLGTTLTAEGAALAAIPGSLAAGAAAAGTAGATTLSIAGSTGASLLTSVGAITTMTQTSNAATAQIQDPGSEEAWKQTRYAALSWLNLGTADMLVKGIGGAKLLNTIVSGVNLVVDFPTAIDECAKEDKTFYSCGGAWAAVIADVGFGALDYKQGQLGFDNPFKNVNNSLFIPDGITDDVVRLAADSVPNVAPGSKIAEAPPISPAFAPPAPATIRDTTATINAQDFFTPQRDLFESVNIDGSRIATEQELNLLLGSTDSPGTTRTTTVLNDPEQIAAELRIITPERAQNIGHLEELNAAKKTEIDAVNDRLAAFGGGGAADVQPVRVADEPNVQIAEPAIPAEGPSTISWIGFRDENGSFQFPIGRKATFTGEGDVLNPTAFDKAAAKNETAAILEDPAFKRIQEKAAELKKANEAGISALTDEERAALIARSEYLATVSDGMIAKQAEFGRAARNARQNDLPPPRLTYDKLTEVVSSTPNERLSFTFDDIKVFTERYDYKGDLSDLKIFLDANGGTATRREILDFAADVEMGWDPRSSLAGNVTPPTDKETNGFVGWWDENVVNPLGDLVFGKKPIVLDNLESPITPRLVQENADLIITPGKNSEFNKVFVGESVGGNAGDGYAAINGAIDRNGKIISFGNIQDIPPDVVTKLNSGEAYRFSVNAKAFPTPGDINPNYLIVFDENVVPTTLQEVLRGVEVKINTPAQPASGIAQTWDRAKQIITQIPETGGGLNIIKLASKVDDLIASPRTANIPVEPAAKITDHPETIGPAVKPPENSGDIDLVLRNDQAEVLADTHLPHPGLIEESSQAYVNGLNKVVERYGLKPLDLPVNPTSDDLKTGAAKIMSQLAEGYDIPRDVLEYQIGLAITDFGGTKITSSPTLDPAFLRTDELPVTGEEIAVIKAAIENEIAELENQLKIARYIDPDTQLLNSHGGNVGLKILMDEKIPATIVEIGFSELKKINDTYGHEVGDVLIKSAAGIIDRSVGEVAGTVPDVLLVHPGGKKFLVVIPDGNSTAVRTLIERVEENVTALAKSNPQDLIATSMQFDAGTAVWNGSESAEELVRRAGDLRSANKDARIALETKTKTPSFIEKYIKDETGWLPWSRMETSPSKTSVSEILGPASKPASKSGSALTNQVRSDQAQLIKDTGLPDPALITNSPEEYVNRLKQVAADNGLEQITIPDNPTKTDLEIAGATVEKMMIDKYEAFTPDSIAEYKAALAVTALDKFPVGEIPTLNPDVFKAVFDSPLEEIAALRQRVGNLNQALSDAVFKDAMTGLYNKAGGEAGLDLVIKAAKATGGRFSVIEIDVSGLGAVNRDLGMLAGDRLIIEAADIFDTVARRSSDIVFRVGDGPDAAKVVHSHGDEFKIILPGTDEKGALKIRDRINEEVNARKAANPDDGVLQRLGVDAGVSEWNGIESADELARRADEAMYANKQARKAAEVLSEAPSTGKKILPWAGENANKATDFVINGSAPMGAGLRSPVLAIAGLGGLGILAGVDYVSENLFGFDLVDTTNFQYNLWLDYRNLFLVASVSDRGVERLETLDQQTQETTEDKINQSNENSNLNNTSIITFGDEFRPIDPANKLNLQVIPTEIIIHWDGQPGGPLGWNTNTTFNGLSELRYDPLTGLYRTTDAHFGIDKNGVVQFLQMNGDTVQFSYGASGYPSAINIEMAGSDFQIYADGTTNVPKEEISNTVNLIIKLMKQYNISLDNVFGHSEQDTSKNISYILDSNGQPVNVVVVNDNNATDRSKADPGTSFMNYIRDEVEKRISNTDSTIQPVSSKSNQTASNITTNNSTGTNVVQAAINKMDTCVPGQGGYYNACEGEYFKGQVLTSTDILGENIPFTSNHSITDLYWCTDLVYDSAKAAGIDINNKIPGAQALYDSMRQEKSVVLSENASYDNDVQAGMVAFVSKPQNSGQYAVAHVGIVSEVINTTESTYITIIQANAGSVEVTYELDSQGRLAYQSENGTIYYIRGFGNLEEYAANQ